MQVKLGCAQIKAGYLTSAVLGRYSRPNLNLQWTVHDILSLHQSSQAPYSVPKGLLNQQRVYCVLLDFTAHIRTYCHLHKCQKYVNKMSRDLVDSEAS